MAILLVLFYKVWVGGVGGGGGGMYDVIVLEGQVQTTHIQ